MRTMVVNHEAERCKVICFNEEKIVALRERIPSPDRLAVLADRYKAMAHPCRLTILHILAIEECCVCDLANILRQPVSTISQHLRMLKIAGLVKSRQEGKLVFYSCVAPEVLSGVDINNCRKDEKR